MAKTIEQLLDEANIIKNETSPGANTAERIGDMCMDIVDYLEDNPPSGQVQSDWDEVDDTKPSFINNKPYILEQQQANWAQTDSTKVNYIQNKPTIPAAQIQADWNQTDSTQIDYIQHKPNIPDVSNVLNKSEVSVSYSEVSNVNSLIATSCALANSSNGYHVIIKVSYSASEYSVLKIDAVSSSDYKVSGYLANSTTTFSLPASIDNTTVYKEYFIRISSGSITDVRPLLAEYSYNSSNNTLNITQ